MPHGVVVGEGDVVVAEDDLVAVELVPARTITVPFITVGWRVQ